MDGWMVGGWMGGWQWMVGGKWWMMGVCGWMGSELDWLGVLNAIGMGPGLTDST